MKSFLYHVQVNVDFKQHGQFYKDLMSFLGWSVVFEMDTLIGFTSGMHGDIWFVDAPQKTVNHYDNIGVNHLSIQVEKQQDVDEVITFLKSKGIATLFDTPRHRPEFAAKETDTYYQIIFETPDRVQLEVVYVGPKV